MAATWRLLIVALAALWLSATGAHSGAWTLEKGRSEFRVLSTFTYGDHGFDGDGNLVSVPDYQKFELRGRLEYGLRGWLTAIVEGEMREETVDTPTASDLFEPVATSYGGVAAGARVRLYQAPSWVFSAEAMGFSGGFTTAGLKAPSDGPAAEVRLLAGASGKIRNIPVFADFQAAYRARFQSDDADEIKLDLTLGARVRPRWLVLAQSFSTFELEGGTHYHKVQATVMRRINRHLEVGLSGIATVAGANAVRELGGQLNFWYTY